jgi:tetratricopeptide (TPR) repeat protein
MDGRWSDAAMEAAQKAISIDPELPEGYKALGFSYGAKGWLTKALECYQRALAIRPQYEAAMGNTAVVLHALGRWDEALIWMRRRLQHAPGHVIGCTNIAEILNDLGFRDEAKLWLDKALAGEPYYFDAHKQLAYRELFGGQAEAAKKRMARLLEVHPNNVGSLLVAGETELFDGNPEQARKLFERAVEASQGTSIYAHLRIGELLWRVGERQQAEQHLAYVRKECRARIESGSEGWFFRWALAVSAAVRDEKEEALDWLARAVDRGRLYYHWDLNEPAFEKLREQTEFQRLMDHMRTKVEKLAQQVSSRAHRRELLLVPEGPMERSPAS